MNEWMALGLFISVCIALLLGYPVAFTLAGVALIFAEIGQLTHTFDPAFLSAIPNRLYGIMTNQILIAVPLFIFMGVMLERSKIAEDLLTNMSRLFGTMNAGLGYSVTIVGMLLAASTGIVGATVVTMGLLALPSMLKRGYDPKLSAGIICASGTLGQIIPPSIVLVLLGDVISSAYQQSQLDLGEFAPKTVSVGDLFLGAILPGLLLVACYILYLFLISIIAPHRMPKEKLETLPHSLSLYPLIKSILPPIALILTVLGSIIGGFATPTEAAAVGAMGAIILAFLKGQLNVLCLRQVMINTTEVTSMVFMILVGASIFSLVFRGFGGDDAVREFLNQLPGGKYTALFLVMLLMFCLGFILDFIEITFVVVPIVGPILLGMGFDPVWLGIIIAINLQTSFLTPPFGFALFYLRGVAPKSILTSDIYRGVIPFIFIQLAVLLLLIVFPSIVTWLPSLIYTP